MTHSAFFDKELKRYLKDMRLTDNIKDRLEKVSLNNHIFERNSLSDTRSTYNVCKHANTR